METSMTSRFPSHTPESAVGRAGDLLGDIVARTGSAGAMVRTMAGSPSVLGGYLELSRAMKRSRLDRAVSERISLAVQARLGCELCLAAHADGARTAGVTEAEIELAQRGTSSDPAIAAIVAFARRIDTEPSTVTAEHVDELRRLGYRDRDILDVVGLVALNVLTGAFNLVAGLELLGLATPA
jgi:AhpD family alkylhydroperoxidase